jgi:hypothetical protein
MGLLYTQPSNIQYIWEKYIGTNFSSDICHVLSLKTKNKQELIWLRHKAKKYDLNTSQAITSIG